MKNRLLPELIGVGLTFGVRGFGQIVSRRVVGHRGRRIVRHVVRVMRLLVKRNYGFLFRCMGGWLRLYLQVRGSGIGGPIVEV